MKKKLQLKPEKTAALRAGRALLRIAPCLLAPASFLNAQTSEASATAPAPGEEIVVLDKVTTESTDDPSFVLPTQPMQGTFGFSKTLVETPRSVSVLGSDLVDRIGIRDGDQLSRIVPGTYTVNRWGIAGATQVRGLPADTYIRGMKRVDPQGNIRNVITMWDNTEIVRGPPSPIYGNGRIGGFVNYTPKSVRGTTGKYLDKPQSSVTAVVASYDRVEAQFNYAQPVTIGGMTGGIQAFGLVNDSDSYYKQNFQRDRVLQLSGALDVNEKWRIETGQIYQRAINAGQAGSNRVSQESFDRGLYLRGSALVNLDTNGDGRVSEAEIQASRSIAGVTGTFTGARPLSVSFGNINLVRGDNTIIGAPRRLRELLQNNPDYADVAATSQGQAIINAGDFRFADGSPANALINNLNNAPVGFFLNPAEARYSPRDWSLVAIEEKADGFTHTAYLDFLDDRNADATQKLQLFYDFQDQEKESQLPFNQKQKIAVGEAKYTITRDASTLPGLEKLPDFVDLNLLSSINTRRTDANRRSTTGDYDHRRDLITGYRPTDTFASFIRTGDESFATGEPVSADTQSDYWESGIGGLIDLTLWERFNTLLGGRYDYISVGTFDDRRYNRLAQNDSAEIDRFNIPPGTSGVTAARTGGFLAPRSVSNDDDGKSWNLSLSYKTPWLGVTPYFTKARASSALTGTFQEVSYENVLDRAIISASSLEEYGFKGNLLNDKLFYAFSRYDQVRTGNVMQEGESYNRATQNEGYEFELRYLPNRNWTFMASVAKIEITRVGLDPTQTRTAMVDANFLGISDIVDADGNVIPANTFLYGGNSLVTISNSDRRFNKFGQYPEFVYGLFVGYNWDNGWSLSWSGNWVDSNMASSEIPNLLVLPSYTTHNFTVAWDNKKEWRVALQIRNAFDEEYFTPNNGSFGGTLLQAGLPRNYELAVTRRF